MNTYIKGMMSRKSGGVRFYDHVFTSANKTLDVYFEEKVQEKDENVEAGNRGSLDDLQSE